MRVIHERPLAQTEDNIEEGPETEQNRTGQSRQQKTLAQNQVSLFEYRGCFCPIVCVLLGNTSLSIDIFVVNPKCFTVNEIVEGSRWIAVTNSVESMVSVTLNLWR
ncbi:hypothetical protein VNO77_44476 [Canavalia gladiata]|uniref:Uncharacterized protein n=1 Tax=Canavalia gladiata TaxID=3824 RepID=A0AAN9PQE2_CANGL